MRCNSNGKRPLIPQSRKQLKIRGKQGFSISRQGTRQGTQSKIAETYKQETRRKKKIEQEKW